MNIPDRIYAQYRDKPKAVAWYEIALKMGGSLVDAAEAVRKSYYIDKAVSQQLDVIGRIVVVPRSFIGNAPLNPAMCAEPDGAEFGDSGQMCSALTIAQDGQLSDELYRLVIKAKIIKNNGDATIENILNGMNFLLPKADVLRVTDGEDMSFSIEFYGEITNLERYALLSAGLVPKPQGVRFNGFLEAFDYTEFGDTTKMCGDTFAQCVGFIGA